MGADLRLREQKSGELGGFYIRRVIRRFQLRILCCIGLILPCGQLKANKMYSSCRLLEVETWSLLVFHESEEEMVICVEFHPQASAIASASNVVIINMV